MNGAARRLLNGFCIGAILLAGAVSVRSRQHVDGRATTRFDTPTYDITPAVRAGGPRFGSAVTTADRAWILAAVAHARPEARRLIGEIDGLVEFETEAGALELPGGGGRAIGVTSPRAPNRFGIVLDVAALDGDAAFSRDVVVLHELGHVIDASLISKDLAARLDHAIPSSGRCLSETQVNGACTAPQERFADTFAKWALRGAVSAAGAGYGIRAPLLDEWGEPLAILAAQAGR